MILIGENIHVISKDISIALKERNTQVIQDLTKKQTEAGVDYIDINLGPARKNPEETMEWIVNTVQDVTHLPLCLDTMNPVAMGAGLKICKNRPLLNSASGKTDSREQMLPLAKEHNTNVVISVITDEGCPPDMESRTESIMETVAYANEMGIPNEDIWVDPIILPVSADQTQVKHELEFIQNLDDLLPGVKSTVGLSNISNGTPEELRPILNRTLLVMLQRYGLHSAIVDSFDEEMKALVQGKLPNITDLIYRSMDGEDVALAGLSQQERDYAKTAKVLLGDILYSHAWLED